MIWWIIDAVLTVFALWISRGAVRWVRQMRMPLDEYIREMRREEKP